jgi:hypothetical protein
MRRIPYRTVAPWRGGMDRMFPLHCNNVYIFSFSGMSEEKSQFPLIARPSPRAYDQSRMKRVEMPNWPHPKSTNELQLPVNWSR